MLPQEDIHIHDSHEKMDTMQVQRRYVNKALVTKDSLDKIDYTLMKTQHPDDELVGSEPTTQAFKAFTC